MIRAEYRPAVVFQRDYLLSHLLACYVAPLYLHATFEELKGPEGKPELKEELTRGDNITTEMELSKQSYHEI